MKEIVNIPETGLEPAGKVTVELFDAKSGELVGDRQKTNFVQERTMKAVQSLLSRTAFSMAGQYDWSYAPYEYFSGLFLSNYAGATDPLNEDFPKGSVVAYGVRNEPSLGTNRGAFNVNESVFRGDYIKLVFDFVTSQGNGTFQSIYTMKWPIVNDFYMTPPNFFAVTMPFNISRFQKGAGFILFETGGNFYKVDELNFAPGSDKKIGINYEHFWPGTSAAPDYVYGFGVIGNKIYIAGFKYQTDVLSIVDMNDKTVVETRTLSVGSFYNITANPKKNHILVEKTSAPYNVHVYDATTWEEVDIITVGNTTNGLTGISEDGLFLIKGSRVFELATGQQWILGTSTNSAGQLYYYTKLGDYAIFRYGTGNTQSLYITPAQTFFSRALLEQPVTKTNLQNMKITYEFTIPKLNIPIEFSGVQQPSYY